MRARGHDASRKVGRFFVRPKRKIKIPPPSLAAKAATVQNDATALGMVVEPSPMKTIVKKIEDMAALLWTSSCKEPLAAETRALADKNLLQPAISLKALAPQSTWHEPSAVTAGSLTAPAL